MKSALLHFGGTRLFILSMFVLSLDPPCLFAEVARRVPRVVADR